MVEFRLIKEYPNSPDIGYITSKSEREDNIKWYKKYPEYWEEIIEKDYIVLAYKDYNNGNIFTKDDGIKMKDGYFYHCNNYGVYSVKRVSDGQIFKLNDLILTPANTTYCAIYHFNEFKDSLRIDCTHGFLLNKMGIDNVDIFKNIQLDHVRLNKQRKKLIMKTHDNFDLYEGDEYYTIYTDGILQVKGPFTVSDDPNDYVFSTVKYFVDRRKADHYLLLNVQVLSIEDVRKVFAMYLSGMKEDKLIVIVEEKLCK